MRKSIKNIIISEVIILLGFIFVSGLVFLRFWVQKIPKDDMITIPLTFLAWSYLIYLFFKGVMKATKALARNKKIEPELSKTIEKSRLYLLITLGIVVSGFYSGLFAYLFDYNSIKSGSNIFMIYAFFIVHIALPFLLLYIICLIIRFGIWTKKILIQK